MSSKIRQLVIVVAMYGLCLGQAAAEGGVGASGGGGSGSGGSMGNTNLGTSNDNSSSGESGSSSSAPASEPASSSSSESETTTNTSSSTQSETTTTSTSSTPPPAPTPPAPPAPGVLVVDISEAPSASYKHTVDSIEIDEVEGEIVINGSGFDTGPNIVLFDNFDNAAVTGADIPKVNSNNVGCSTDTFGLDVESVAGPLIGCWNDVGDNTPIYHDTSHTGSHSMQGWGGADVAAAVKKDRRFYKDFANATEVFISYWAHIPAGDYFPGRWDPTAHPGGPKLQEFPSDSSWKMAWLLQDGEYDNYYANLCTPTVIFGGGMIGGNSNNVAGIGNFDQFWSWTNFTRLSTWLRADPSDVLGAGDMIFQAMSLDKGFYQASTTDKPIFVDNGPRPGTSSPAANEKYFNQLSIPGWFRGAGPNDTQTQEALYDNIYLAIGENAVSRVEIGNAPTYLGNTQVLIQLPITWTDNKIKINIAELEGIDINDAYLYITDTEGNFNSNGYALQ